MREKLRSQRETMISLPKPWDSRRNRETWQVWTLCEKELRQRFQSYVPCFEISVHTYRESVTIFFHSFQVINMVFFMCWLIFCDNAGIGGIVCLSQWVIALLLFFDIQTNFSKQLFAIYNMRLSCLEIDRGSSKQLKCSRSFHVLHTLLSIYFETVLYYNF